MLVRQSYRVCGHCRAVFYCSRKCQVEDWHSRHKQPCQRYSALKKVEEQQTAEASSSATNSTPVPAPHAVTDDSHAQGLESEMNGAERLHILAIAALDRMDLEDKKNTSSTPVPATVTDYSHAQGFESEMNDAERLQILADALKYDIDRMNLENEKNTSSTPVPSTVTDDSHVQGLESETNDLAKLKAMLDETARLKVILDETERLEAMLDKRVMLKAPALALTSGINTNDEARELALKPALNRKALECEKKTDPTNSPTRSTGPPETTTKQDDEPDLVTDAQAREQPDPKGHKKSKRSKKKGKKGKKGKNRA